MSGILTSRSTSMPESMLEGDEKYMTARAVVLWALRPVSIATAQTIVDPLHASAK